MNTDTHGTVSTSCGREVPGGRESLYTGALEFFPSKYRTVSENLLHMEKTKQTKTPHIACCTALEDERDESAF